MRERLQVGRSLDDGGQDGDQLTGLTLLWQGDAELDVLVPEALRSGSKLFK